MKILVPDKEAQRLAALRRYEVLDTPAEQAFDDLTLLATQICQVPIAMVSLVDENRQWFKSKVGLSAAETSRDIAFCAHTILRTDEVLEVRDAQADSRFAQSPLVTAEPRIRFYAGAPLVTADGHALGALCVMDRMPRSLTPEQLAGLQALSRRVVAQLELGRQTQELTAREQEASRMLLLAGKSRRALLSVLEDEKLTMASLRESETRFRQMAESIEEVFWMSDVEKKEKIYISPKYETVWGRKCDELYAASRTWLESIHAEDRERVQRMATKQITGGYDETYRIVRPGGEVRWIRDRAFPVKQADGRVRRIVGVAEDVTDRKALEDQFLHAQRMEAIGTLASGVAHDLNNILAPMLMVAGILKLRPNTSAQDLELLTIIETSGQRGAGIIRQLLTFSRGPSGDRVTMQARDLLHDMGRIMTQTFPRNLTIVETVPADLWMIEADATQLHQVIMNLCVNARDAMPAGGTLTLAAANVSLGVTEAAVISPALPPGRYLRLQVSDTGTGIPPEIIKRIFEPFFTTKEVGKGTGLGLSTVLGIIKSHGGGVQVKSEPDRGTTFLVYLPASAERPELVQGFSMPPLSVGQGELILLVDDEASILETNGSLLQKYGYRVLLAGSGEEAVKLCIKHQGTLRLVLTDMMMPGMDGLALIRTLKLLQRSLRVIATSGLDQEHNRAELAALGVSEILAKPFTPASLLQAVRAALAA